MKCVLNEDLKEEWEKYLDQTRNHERILVNLLRQLSLDAEEDSPGRRIIKQLGGALVQAMETARGAGNPAAAELCACECVVLAETKDHLDWELISRCAEKSKGERTALKEAVDEVEEQEDEHLYHSKGWCRELWLQSLGMKARPSAGVLVSSSQ